ncbi:MAG: LysM peptidoglycan-binding domain-containing protein [Rhizobiaceae bacterium]
MAYLKKNPLASWLVAGTVAAGAGGGAYFYSNPPATEPASIVSSAPESSQTKSAETQPVVKEAPAADAAQTAEPRFDILRVEKDGSAVIAGTAAPSSTVDILSGGEVLASTAAGSGGDFAIVLDKPLAPGSHELALRSTLADGSVVMSSETGIVNVPEGGGELLAMVTKEGEASRVLQQSASEQTAGEQPATEQPASGQATSEQPAAEPSSGAASTEATASEPASGEAKPAADIKPVMVQAVDVEGGKIFIAGTGEPGRAINLYLDDQLVGTATVGAEGGFLLEANAEVTGGNHRIRADMLEDGSATVATRAEVNIVHEVPTTEVAKAEPEVKPAAEQPKAEETTAAPAAEQPKAEETTAAPAAEQPKAEETAAAPAAEQPKAEETAAATQQPAASEPIKTGASVIIRRGDSLWQVSRRMLGAGIRYTTIFDANRDQIKDPDLIYPGQVFDVPGGVQDGSKG